jgi:hypothetical protein
LSDSYLTIPDSKNGNSIELQTRPGRNRLSLITSGDVNKILLDGKPINYTKTSADNVINFSMNTPDFSAPQIKCREIRFKPDDDADKDSEFKAISYKGGIYPSLDSLGDYQNGYFIYKGKFEIDGRNILRASYFSDDWHSIYIDGEPVKDLTENTFNDYSEVKLSKGMHDIKIIFENKGRPNTGFMEEKKGIKSLNLLSPEQFQILKEWKFSAQLVKQPDSNHVEANPGYNDSAWINFEAGNNIHETPNNDQAGSWYRKKISLNSKQAEDNPRLIFEGISRSAVVFVNGKQVYKFTHHGWDGPFNVLLNGVLKPGENLIALYIENAKGRGGIAGPIEFEYGTEVPLKLVQFSYHASLNGELAGWEKPDYNDSGWKVIQNPGNAVSNSGIKWYRSWFKVPQVNNWIVPLFIHVKSTGNLQIWLNGRLLGLYFAVGPQDDFYIPNGWLREKNSLVFVMRPGLHNVAPEFKDFSIQYYKDYVVQKHELEIK